MNFTHSRHNSIVTTALPIPAVVCVGEWVVLVRCVGCGCGVGVLSGENLSFEKERFSPDPPLSKETFTKLYPFLLLLYRSNRLYFFGKIIFD